ncbi:Aquaporin Z [hydrothermal vent metagenome]|uniref:Aquaporin Z n=1 Tax=hydrothermal vent metagenome TaxID=652676 RepID=A0A1W1CQX5_9ZZZZ
MKAYWAEFVGTYMLVFAGCGAIVVEALTGAMGSWYQSFLFEMILPFILMLLIYSSAVHGKAIKSFAVLAGLFYRKIIEEH